MTDHQIDVTPAQRDALAALVQRHQDAFEAPTGRAGSWNTLDHDLAALLRSSGSPLVLSDADVEFLKYACEREEWTGRDRPWNGAPADLRPVVSVIESLAGEMRHSLRPPREFAIAVTDDQHDALIAAVERYANGGDVLGNDEAYLDVTDTARHVRAPGPVVVLTSGDLSTIADVIRNEGWAQEPGMKSLVDGVNFAMQELPFRDTSRPLSPLDESGMIPATDAERSALAPYVKRYIAWLEDVDAPEQVLVDARQALLQVTASNDEIRVSPTHLNVLSDMVAMEGWDRGGDMAAQIPDDLRGVVERIITNTGRAAMLERAAISQEPPTLPSAGDIMAALLAGTRGREADVPDLDAFAALGAEAGTMEAAFESVKFVELLQERVHDAKSYLQGRLTATRDEDRVDALGLAVDVVNAYVLRSLVIMEHPTWYTDELVAAARNVDWSDLASDRSEGLLVGIHHDGPTADTLRHARSTALLEVREDQERQLEGKPEYPRPVPPVFGLGWYRNHATTVAEVFELRGYPVITNLAAELGVDGITRNVFVPELTPAGQQQIVDAVMELRDGLAARGCRVDMTAVLTDPVLAGAETRERTQPDRGVTNPPLAQLPTPREVASALGRAERGLEVDDLRLAPYVKLVETADRNLSIALDSPTLIRHIEDQIREAKGGLEGLVRPGTEEDRVAAIGFAKVVVDALESGRIDGPSVPRPTWWNYEAIAAARHVDWSPLVESPAEGLLVGIRGTSPEADTLRLARSAALVEVRFDQDQKLVAAPDYPQPDPDVFALGAYTWQISTPAEMFTTEGYPWVGLLARELALTPVPDALGFGRDFTPAEEAQAKVFIAALSDGLATRGYPVDTDKLDIGRADGELVRAAHARDREGTVEAMWEAGYISRLEAGHAWATAEPAAQDELAKQVLTEKVATYGEVQQLTAAVRAAKPSDERLASDFDTVSAEPLARQGERAIERLAWIAGRWDGLDPVIQDGINSVGAMTAELSSVPSLQSRSSNAVREARFINWTRTADAGVIGLERAQTEQGLAALQRPEQTREAPSRAAQAPAPATDADEGLSDPPRPRGLSARIEAEVARRTPSTSDRPTETDKTRSR